jgi:intein/homing endonuclease
MILNKANIRELENTYGRHFPDDLERYLLVQYAQEPFPYEFSEQDLYMNIERDIHDYDAGKLDVTIKSSAERWQEEREYLQNLYGEKCLEARELEDYVAELEQLLLKHGMGSSRMLERQSIQF